MHTATFNCVSFSAIEIGFEKINYTAVEESNGDTVAICCKIWHTNLTLARPLDIDLVVLSNSTATGKALNGTISTELLVYLW